MSFTHETDIANRTVFSRATGEVTDDDLMAHRAAIRSDPDFEPDFRHLVDLRGVTKMSITADGLGRLLPGSFCGPGARRALVALRDVDYGMARMHQMAAGPTEKRVFRDMDEALRWLGLEDKDQPKEPPHE